MQDNSDEKVFLARHSDTHFLTVNAAIDSLKLFHSSQSPQYSLEIARCHKLFRSIKKHNIFYVRFLLHSLWTEIKCRLFQSDLSLCYSWKKWFFLQVKTKERNAIWLVISLWEWKHRWRPSLRRSPQKHNFEQDEIKLHSNWRHAVNYGTSTNQLVDKRDILLVGYPRLMWERKTLFTDITAWSELIIGQSFIKRHKTGVG